MVAIILFFIVFIIIYLLAKNKSIEGADKVLKWMKIIMVIGICIIGLICIVAMDTIPQRHY